MATTEGNKSTPREDVDPSESEDLPVILTGHRLASIVEFLPDATFVLDREMRIIAWNRACERMTEVPRESLIGQGNRAYAKPFFGTQQPTLVDLMDGPDPVGGSIYESVRRDGNALSAEYFAQGLRGGKGAYLWGQASPLFDDNGQRCGAIEIVRDITDQKRIEQALGDSRERLMTAQRVARVGFLDWDLRTNEIFLSDETCELTGFHPEGPVVTPDFVVQSVHPDDLAYTGENLKLAIQGTKPYDIVHRHLRPDGEIVWVHAQAELSRDEAGTPIRLLGTMVDITQQKHVEEALAASEREYRELVTLANSIILRWSREGRVTFLNDFGLRFFGYEREEIVGQHVVGTIVPQVESTGRDLRPLMEEICSDPIRFERSHNENMRRNGERVWIDWTNKVVLDSDGQIREILSIGSDITERMLAEERVRNLNQELQRHIEEMEQRVIARTSQLAARNQELKDFAYTVSHDLKAPLRGIAGYANELDHKHRAGLSERGHFCLTQILTATSNLDQLIEDLLRYSRLDSETPAPTVVNLEDLVRGILRDRELSISEQHIEVVVDIAPGRLLAWERGIAQVLSNLIDNAIKYSRKADHPHIRISASTLNGTWRIAVGDNGIGFDMKYHDRIFKLFNRLVRMEDFEGTGAGLAIARKVLERQRGRIWAESSPGQGATFYVELPESIETPKRDSVW